jgi:transaldolase / glucose-6-phosphate isomerase
VTDSPALTHSVRLPDPLREAVEQRIARAVEERWAARIWQRDTSVWTADEQVAERIADRLGWLDAPDRFRERIDELEAFAAAVRGEGFTDALVCGMGGSSLAPEVLSRSFRRAESGLRIRVLDSTDPEAVIAAQRASEPRTTLFLIASKSGTTTETLAFLSYFWAFLDDLHGSIPDSVPGEHFVAITDPGRPVDAIPHTEAFRSVFLNPADVGGRYSALTYVGLVPAALMGLDLGSLLDDAALMAERCRTPDESNPGLWLGATLGALAQAGRDKLTFIIDPRLAAFGAWLEQLIAESTGKHGTGIVPIDGEPLGDPAVYGDDRVFVDIRQEGDTGHDAGSVAAVDALADAGHPIIRLSLPPTESIGAEFFRWEFATAVAGVCLGVDPFDEPNVTESKENTRRVLDRFRETGSLPDQEPVAEEGRLRLYGDAPLRLSTAGGGLVDELRRHLQRVRPSGYLALQAYVARTPEREAALTAIRTLLRDRTGRATTVGYGPRFLHSTGQLHKGGPTTGCFLQLVAGHPSDLPFEGQARTFGTLIDAQSLGDMASLESHDLPVLRVHLSDDPDAGLDELRDALERAL